FLSLTASTVFWIHGNRTPPSWDPSDHLSTAYDYYAPLSRSDFAGFFREIFQGSHPYAPLFHLLTAGIFLLLGPSVAAGIAANLVALAILLFSVDWIWKYLHRDERFRAGWIAALLAVCYHFSAWLLHEAFLDYLLTAMVALTFMFLLRAGEF